MAELIRGHRTWRRTVKPRWIGILVLALCCLYPTHAAAGAEGLYLGILESPTDHYVGEKHRTPYMVRVVFRYKDGKWQAAPDNSALSARRKAWDSVFPAQIHWTVGLDGKKRGHFTSQPMKPQRGYSSDEQIQQPDSGGDVPLIKQGAKSFVYWDYTAPFRPLVCTSGNFVDDPDLWKPDPVSLKVPPTSDLLAAFRKADPVNSALNAERIKVDKAYKCKSATQLISLIRIDPGKTDADYGPGEEPEPFWFFVDGKNIKLLGQSLQLLDAGDYDHDGHSEVVFHKTSYNYDGYILLFDDMRRQAEFGWAYH